MEAEKKVEPRNFPLPEALAIAIASSIVYLLSFLYERGYATHFGIPPQFVSVSLTNLLIFGAAAFTFLYTATNLAGAILPLTRHQHPYLAFHLPRVVVFFFLLVIFPLLLFVGSGWMMVVAITASCWLVLVFFVSITPLLGKGKKGWKDRLDAAQEAAMREPPTIYDHISARSGIPNFNLYVAALIIATLLAGLVGLSEATRQRDFLITNTTPEMVVLRVYGENMICARFDRQNKEVKKSFSILKVAEDPKLLLNLERIGPLTPVETLASEAVEAAPTPAPTPHVENTTSITPTPAPTESPKSEASPPAEQKPVEKK